MLQAKLCLQLMEVCLEVAMATSSICRMADGEEVLPCNNKELVDLGVLQLVAGVPNFSFHLLLDPGVNFI